MKYILTTLLFFCSPLVHADLRRSDLHQPAPMTQEGALLNQIDVLSLYFSSSRVAHAPRLTRDKVIEIESTVLDDSLTRNPEKLREHLTRQIVAFVGALKERLNLYAPSIARNFHADRDIRFLITVGSDREPKALWERGAWRWIEPNEAASLSRTPLALAQTAGGSSAKRKDCSCPARRPK